MPIAIKKRLVFEWAWLVWFEWMANENRAYLIDLSDLGMVYAIWEVCISGMGLAMRSLPNLGMTPAIWEVCISGMGLAIWEVCISGMGLAIWEVCISGMGLAIWGTSHVGTIFAVKKCAIGGRFLLTGSTKIWYNGGWFSKPGGACAPEFFPNFHNKS